MPRIEDLAFKPATSTAVVTSTSNAIGTVTIAAPAAGLRVYILGYSLSYTAAVATIHNPTIVSGALTIESLQIPVGVINPVLHSFARAVECPVATSVVITVPAAGAVISTIAVRYFIA